MLLISVVLLFALNCRISVVDEAQLLCTSLNCSILTLRRKRIGRFHGPVSYVSCNVSDPLYIDKKQTPWPLVRERTIPTERPPLVVEI
jgi:hypothetical protein